MIVIFWSISDDFIICASITILQSCEQLISIFSSGTTIDGNLCTGATGVIISTPSGSTGHSFSIGGPLLHESLDVLIITPVAPVHRLPSIVVPDEKIEINCSHDCNIVMDAQMIKSSEVDQKITIKKFKNQAVFVRLKKKGLRQMNKLGF